MQHVFWIPVFTGMTLLRPAAMQGKQNGARICHSRLDRESMIFFVAAFGDLKPVIGFIIPFLTVCATL